MDEQTVFSAHFVRDLSDCFDERQTFYIARSSADLGNNNVRGDLLADRVNEFLYFAGYVRNNLHGFAVVYARAFGVKHVPVDLTGR